MLYSKLIYPQAVPGVEYTQPQIPETYIENVFCSPNWDTYSINDKDRTEFWSDTAGTYTEDQVRIELELVTNKTRVVTLP